MHAPWDALEPMLTTRASAPFDARDWVFDLKWGGVRAIALIDDDRLVLRGLRRIDLTPMYPELQPITAQVKARRAVLDGEIVALTPEGYPDLETLRPRLNGLLQQPEGRVRRARLGYMVTDLLALDDRLLLDRPLWERRELLDRYFQPSVFAQVGNAVEEAGVEFFEAIEASRLDGMLAKQRDSVYVPGQRSPQWLDIPTSAAGYFVVGGYIFGGGRRKAPFDALLLGAYDAAGGLRYVGQASTGLSTPEGWRTERLLTGLHTSHCPFTTAPGITRFIYWCTPSVVCQVRTGERSPTGLFRFARFVALRPDLEPAECKLEPQPTVTQ